MEVFIGLEIFSVILSNVLTLMISLLLFSIPERMINVCVTILSTDFISDPGLIYLDFNNAPPWYSYTKELSKHQDKLAL